MSYYVDGFLLPVKPDQLEQYKKIAEASGKIWIEHGALAYVESIGDDMQIEGLTSFTKSADASPDEIVVFAWILFKSREHRDEVNAAVMADPRMDDIMPANTEELFEMHRMAYGGFKTVVDLINL